MRLTMFFLLAGMILLVGACGQQPPEEKDAVDEMTGESGNATDSLIAFVQSAGDELEKRGTETFGSFREKDGPWFDQDRYIFVWGLDGFRYVYPPDPSGENKNVLDLKDVDGRPIGRMFIDEVKGADGQGWVHYRWPKPGHEDPEWKSTFLIRAKSTEGVEYLVGSGLYDLPMQEIFVTDAVYEAIETIQQGGVDLLEENSFQFTFMDSYVFVKDMDGNELFNPAHPELVGKNLMDLTDADGKKFVREEIDFLKTHDTMWAEYQWPPPGSDSPILKRVFLAKTRKDDRELVVGCGYHP